MASTELIEARIDKDIAGNLPMTQLGATFRNMMEVMEFAKMMAVAGPAVPSYLRGNPGACLAVVQQASALGFEPFSFARKCYFVNEQLAYESQLIHAIIIRRAPFTKRPTIAYTGEGPERQCIVTLHMEEPEGDKVYTSPLIKDIKPQNSPLWKTDPDQQLAYYSLRAAARRYVPDVIMGMYDLEEMAAERAKDVTPVTRPRTDIASALAGGSATPFAGNGPSASADPAEEQTPTQQQDAPAAPESGPAIANADPAPSGALDDAILMELRTALLQANGDQIGLRLVYDEFAETMGIVAPALAETMRNLFAEAGYVADPGH